MSRRTTTLGMLALLTMFSAPAAAQTTAERFWVAGRYDGNRVIVFFDAVKFGGLDLPNGVRIAPPVASSFFDPVELPFSFVAGFQKDPKAEHFKMGDRYDLLLGGQAVVTMTLTTPIGCHGDEVVGNDSFIGALGTVDSIFAGDYFVVRRHRDVGPANAGLAPEPVRFDIQQQIEMQVRGLGKTAAVPAFETQSFTTAAGDLRYYVRAEWKAQDGSTEALAAWMSPQPSLHVLATERQTNQYGFPDELPELRNVVDLGAGVTGMVVSVLGEDERELKLVAYRDGADLGHMRVLQSIGAGE